MPQDKRLIVTKAVVQRVQRVRAEEKKDPSDDAVYLDFIIPAVMLQRDTSITEKMFVMPHSVFPQNGRGSVLICPMEVATSCARINKRHKYYDAIVPLETIIMNDAVSIKRATQVTETFQRFVTDEHCALRLPTVIKDKCRSRSTAKVGDAAAAGAAPTDPMRLKTLTIIPPMTTDDAKDLSFFLSQGAKGMQINATKHGQCRIRVGHGAMTAGSVCENAKTFVFSLKSTFPGLEKFISEIKMGSTATGQLRFMEVNIQR